MSRASVRREVPTREHPRRPGAHTALASLLLLSSTLACHRSQATVSPDAAQPEDGVGVDEPDAASEGKAGDEGQGSSDADALDVRDDAEPPVDAETASATQTITFDGMDAPGGPEDEIRAAPQREDIESFEIFGVGGRGGPGQSLTLEPEG